MFRLWIVVANKTGARVMEYSGRVSGMKLVKNIPNPEGRLKSKEIETDRPGRGTSNAHEQTAIAFAHEIAEMLDKDRRQGLFQDLVLVAEPGFLGKIKGELKKETADRVVSVHPKNLAEVPDRELPEHLETVIADYNPLLSGAMS